MSYGTITILRYIITKLSISHIRGYIIMKIQKKNDNVYMQICFMRENHTEPGNGIRRSSFSQKISDTGMK